VSPITSALGRFRDEFEAYLADAEPYDDGTTSGLTTAVPVALSSGGR
jgi:hypothetical protein